MNIKKLLSEMVEKDASDLFCHAGSVPRYKINGDVISVDGVSLSAEDMQKALDELTNPVQKEAFKNNMDVDFSIYVDELQHRFRVSIFLQRGCPAIVVRNIRKVTQSFEDLSLPAEVLKKLSMETRGLVLLTGTMGSGKSTTIASMVEYINSNCRKHILTVEEPIEFTFEDKVSFVNQRELGPDVSSYGRALRAFTLQSPDVMFIGNIRDAETMSAAITAAETGVLVLSTLHTVNASQTVERIVNFFSPHQHNEVRNQLAALLKGIISLRLIPRMDGRGRVPAYEVMILTSTISRLIRENKPLEIPQFLESGAVFGMQSFTQSLVKLVKDGKVSEEQAMNFADSKEEFMLALKGIKKA